MGKGHSGATCALLKDGLSFQWMLRTWRRNCHARFSGLCYMWNETRWSLLALKFSYSKILSYFPFPLMQGIFLYKAQLRFFFSSRQPAFFAEKIQRSFLFSEIYYFLLLALWAVRKESVCLKSCSHWLEHSYSGCLARIAPSFFCAAVSIYKPETSPSVSVVSPFVNLVVWHEWGFEQPKQCYWWDHTDDLWNRDWHHRLFLIPEIRSSSVNAWEPIL